VAEAQLFGRELKPADRAVMVTVRHGQRVLSAPPAQDSVLIDRINVIECADLDAALPAPTGGASPAGRPYLLLTRIGPAPTAITGDRELIAAVESWRRDLMTRGRYVMGSSFGGIEPIATLALREGASLRADSPFNQVDDLIIAIDVVLAPDRRYAIEFAATHPLARTHSLEVRPFRTRG
jgi:hypothetical protein